MLRLLAGLMAATLALALATPAAAQSMLDGEFDPAIPTLEQIAGHRPGTQISRPEQVTAYMQALAAAAPERVRLVEYARSWEGRPLVYAVISSPANMARVDAIQADLQTLAQGASGAETAAVIQRAVPVTLAHCAAASILRTPGKIGRPGMCPGTQNSSSRTSL